MLPARAGSRSGTGGPRRGPRRPPSRRVALEDRDAAAALGQLVGDGAADDATTHDEDGGRHQARPRASRKAFVAAAGRSAARMAEIAATPAAPAASASRTRPGVIPPMASTGTAGPAATPRRAPSPMG